jgi:pectin methylesterase-like acyl-CoA thioesterase
MSPEMKLAMDQPNTATVWPGGATFNSISAALASITDASDSQPYTITIGPGTYSEQIKLKPWIALTGAGADQTIITFHGFASPEGNTQAVVLGASNASLHSLTVYCPGWQQPVAVSQALYCQGVANFYCFDVTLKADDRQCSGQGNIVLCLTTGNDAVTPSQITLANCTLIASATDPNSSSRALNCFYGANIQADGCTITSTCVPGSNVMSWGAVACYSSTLSLVLCTVSGLNFSLNLMDPGESTVTATDCKLTGPVAPGVKVVNQA